jgi:radical SAM-linked protein
MMRLRITFAKTDAMRFTSHLDLHRAWERTFRRAGLPLAYTQGFSPHPRLNLASALPLGFTGEAEIIDAWLESDLPIAQITESLNPSLPPGIQLHSLFEVKPSLPALQSVLEANEYWITLLDHVAGLQEKIEAILDSESILRERRGKTYDLRRLIEALVLQETRSGDPQQLLARLSAREGATGRPEEVLETLGIPPTSARIHRKRLIFAEEASTPAGA